MSGGKEAQIAFYYQNLVAVLKILNSLRSGKLLSARVEQKLRDSTKEIDLILEFSDRHFEYYEVKSGEKFTDDGIQIKSCLQALFLHYQSQAQQEQATYSVVINPDFLPPVARFAADIRRFSKNKTVTQSFRNYCTSWGIESTKITTFHTFMKMLSLDHEMSLARLKVEVLAVIESITSDFFINADHALPKEDLLNRLIELLINSIEQSSGLVNVQDFAKAIIDWSARNVVAYKTAQGHDVRTMLEEVKLEIATKLQPIFPSVVITSPSLSSSTDITET